MRESIGVAKVRTSIAGCNVVLKSKLSETSVKTQLERCLETYTGVHVGAMIGTGAKLTTVLTGNPFSCA